MVCLFITSTVFILGTVGEKRVTEEIKGPMYSEIENYNLENLYLTLICANTIMRSNIQ
jgi:hypothetical protein